MLTAHRPKRNGDSRDWELGINKARFLCEDSYKKAAVGYVEISVPSPQSPVPIVNTAIARQSGLVGFQQRAIVEGRDGD